jgi:hypothetical protein
MMSPVMRARHTLLALAASVLLGAGLAACRSSDDPLASHSPSAPAGDEATPSPHAYPDLEARLPSKIRGRSLDHASFDGPTFLAKGTEANRAALSAMLGQLGHGINDLSLAEATDPRQDLQFIEGIFRVAGTRPDSLEPAWIDAQQAATNHRLVQAAVTIGGVSVTKLSDPQFQAGGTTYVLPRGDSLVLIVADDLKLVEEAIAQVH